MVKAYCELKPKLPLTACALQTGAPTYTRTAWACKQHCGLGIVLSFAPLHVLPPRCIKRTPSHWPDPPHALGWVVGGGVSVRGGKRGSSAGHRDLLVHLGPGDLGMLLLHHLVELAEVDLCPCRAHAVPMPCPCRAHAVHTTQLVSMPTVAAAPRGSQRSVASSDSGGRWREGHFSLSEVSTCAPVAREARTSVARAWRLMQLSSSRKKRNSPVAARAATLRPAPR